MLGRLTAPLVSTRRQVCVHNYASERHVPDGLFAIQFLPSTFKFALYTFDFLTFIATFPLKNACQFLTHTFDLGVFACEYAFGFLEPTLKLLMERFHRRHFAPISLPEPLNLSPFLSALLLA